MQTIQQLTFEGIPPSGIVVSSKATISSDAGKKAELAADPQLIQGFGSLYMGTVSSSTAIAFLSESAYTGPPDHALVVLPRVFLAHMKHFFLALWLIKDNSGNCGPVCVCLDLGSKAVGSIQGHDSMSLSARCTLEPVTFTQAEVETALKYHRQFESLIPRMKADPLAPSVTGVIDKNRTSRTLFLIQAARNAGDVGLKGAFYSMCFESLFSTDVTEVSHRVSERTASFLGTNGGERRAIYMDMHDLYAIRSPVVHGSHIKEGKIPAYLALLTRCDDHLRRCLRRILDEPDMLELFSGSTTPTIANHFLHRLFPDEQG